MNELNIAEVLKYLPHRYPFLLVDKVLSYQAGKELTAIKNVTINEHFFAGHFPKQPVMPGVLIVEALAQAACVLAFVSTRNSPEEEIYFLAGINNAKFKRIVEPGDQLNLHVEVLRNKRDVMKIIGTASVDGELACTAEIISVRKGEM